MKEGTLVAHRKWGKAFVTEVLDAGPPGHIQVRWFSPISPNAGEKVVTSIVWQKQVTILSEPAG